MAINRIQAGGDAGREPDAEDRSPGRPPPAAARHVDRSDISALASLLSQLQQLQQSDPGKVTQVLASVAGTLQAEASQASVAPALLLGQLAERFQQAAETGNLSALLPAGPGAPQPGPAPHHGHRGYDTVQSSGVLDPMEASPIDLAQVVEAAMRRLGVG